MAMRWPEAEAEASLVYSLSLSLADTVGCGEKKRTWPELVSVAFNSTWPFRAHF